MARCHSERSPPALGIDFDGVLEIGEKDVLELRGELRAEDDGVRFVVVQEAQIVQVAAADRGPVAVHDHRFGVHDVLLALEDLDARIEQVAVVRPRCIQQQLRVRESGDEYADVDAAGSRFVIAAMNSSSGAK